jgi:D-inositol-3-phosphate glycosyltransferase
VAVISLHTSPLDQPGTGDSGGMNVYVRAVAERLAEREVAVDVYTRCAGRGVPEVEDLAPLTRVIQIPAGPCAPLPKDDLGGLAPAFADAVFARADADGSGYDLVHAHYWLSGWTGRLARNRWDVPLVASFHTLGRVKNMSLAEGERPDPPARLAGEAALIGAADRILAPTPAEAAHLEWLYGAAPSRIRIVPPGVDPLRFHPRPKGPARETLGLSGRRVVLFVGRLQPLKGPDVAIRAFAEAVASDPQAARDLVLVVVGGPSGPGSSAELPGLSALARALGVEERVRFLPPRPHDRLPELYAAADVVLMPSRSESFGLVALEAQASGVPVVAAAVGGLRYVVSPESGVPVRGHDPVDYAGAILRVLRDPEGAVRMSRAAVRQAARFPWEASASRVQGVYAELVPGLEAESAVEIPA